MAAGSSSDSDELFVPRKVVAEPNPPQERRRSGTPAVLGKVVAGIASLTAYLIGSLVYLFGVGLSFLALPQANLTLMQALFGGVVVVAVWLAVIGVVALVKHRYGALLLATITPYLASIPTTYGTAVHVDFWGSAPTGGASVMAVIIFGVMALVTSVLTLRPKRSKDAAA
jgi:hypothetical protein